MEEWTDAETSIQVVGRTCVTMLSESVKLYFHTWEELLGIECHAALKPHFQKGFLAGYVECFRQAARLNWEECPADLSIIEQVVLARNMSAHHNGDIGRMSVHYPKEIRLKIENPLFLHEHEKNAIGKEDEAVFTFLGSELIITRDTLAVAVRHIELLVDWMEPQLQDVRWRPNRRRGAIDDNTVR